MVIDLNNYKKEKFFNKQNSEIETALFAMHMSLTILDIPCNYNHHNIRTVIATLKANIGALEQKLKQRGYGRFKNEIKT